MIYRIADFNIDISFTYPQTRALLRNYVNRACDNVDFSVCVTAGDVEFERQLAYKTDKNLRFSSGYLEGLALLRKLCPEFLKRDAFLMHGACIEYEEKGYIFTALSGTGKTTHILLWKKHFGEENVKIVNGDKPIIRKIDGKFYAYGTPWCGKEGYNINMRTSLHALCFIKRAEENKIARIPEEKAISRLFSQIMITDSADLAKQLELVGDMVDTTPMYQLLCNMDAVAAIVAYEGMNN